jgi:hypothetical protein
MTDVVMDPCAADIRRACEEFDADFGTLERALRELFRQYPKNTDAAHVFLKVTALNALYGTQIPLYSARIPVILEVANHIVGLVGIDTDLDRGSEELVWQITKVVVSGKADRSNYSFATKYCSWQRPEFYPIFDSRVVEYLWHLRNHNCVDRFRKELLWDYPAFKKIVTQFRDKFGLGDFTFKQVDKFLYLQGGTLLSRKGKVIPPKDRAEIGDTIETLNENGRDVLPTGTVPR